MRCSVRVVFLPFCWALILAGSAALAQPANPNAIIGGVGNSLPTLSVAPGQLVTFFVPNSGVALTAPVKAQQATLPLSLAGFSAIFGGQPMPILMVQPVSTCTVFFLEPDSSCGGTIAVTAQIPFFRRPCPGLLSCEVDRVAIAINGVAGPLLDVLYALYQVHFLTSCDLIVPAPPIYLRIAPCLGLVQHADGTAVNLSSPARGGEELVAYAIGLGQTDPPMITGQPATGPARVFFNVDFNYRPNALATRPAPYTGGEPAIPNVMYIGATPGYAGLYQLNFIVPPPPPGLAPCVDSTKVPSGSNVVQANLTVSVGDIGSFDGVGICVQPN